MYDSIFHNCNLVTLVRDDQDRLGVIQGGLVATRKGKLTWVGPEAEFQGKERAKSAEWIDCRGAWITPGLIECHTHLVFAGNRYREFEMRQQGASYEEIAREGGGILSTVRSTREASSIDLLATCRKRMHALFAEGVTTVEIKSGYGLSLEDERKILKVAEAISDELPVSVRKTFLGAHTVPSEFSDNRKEYVNLICSRMIPELASEGLLDAVDIFCESIGFNIEETKLICEAAARAGCALKMHAGQLSEMGGARMVAEYSGLSADHIEHLDEASVRLMAEKGTVAVLLPGAYYFLKETKKPPVQLLRDHGVPMAVSSDTNPGTSPSLSPLMMMNMACVLFGLTPEEALLGYTLNAAKALGMEDQVGSLEAGKDANLAIWDIATPTELSYWIGGKPLIGRIFRGEGELHFPDKTING